MILTTLALLLAPSLPRPLAAPLQDEASKPLEGHSGHGEIFNEGPRQAAYLMENNGSVHFPVTTSVDSNQAMFDQGVGQLHGFWYFEAERSFRQVAALDPACAMAYWGMSLANLENEERAAGFAREAWLRREDVSAREQDYIDAFARFYGVDQPLEEELEDEADAEESEEDENEESEEKPAFEPKPKKDKERYRELLRDLDGIIFRNPEDIEAKALLVNQIWLANRHGLTLGSRQANQALLEQVFAAQPQHPAHHYRIHLWDQEENAEYAVDSAVRSGPTWPTVAHMWHMGGHIFDRLHRYSDAAWQQEASARVDHAHMMRDRVLPDQIHNFAHNNEWLIRSQNKVGRVRDSISLAKNMIELPRHPLWNMPDESRSSSWWGRKRLFETLELFELWEELIALSTTMYLEPSEDRADQAFRHYLLGKAHLFLERPKEAQEQLDLLQEVLAAERAARVESLEEAEREALERDEKDEDVIEEMTAALQKHKAQLKEIRRLVLSLEVLSRVLSPEVTIEDLEELAEAGNHELLLSRLYLQLGDPEKALEIAEEAKKEGRAYGLANHAHVLYQAEKIDEALAAFSELRKLSARFDLDAPVFQRLGPLVELAELPDDWRIEFAYPEDIGERIDLDSLGPARWSPTDAPDWSCPDSAGEQLGLADCAGKPTLLILFLGFGCVHCVEQLNAFEPATGQFEDAGIDIVTIGNQSVEELALAGVEDYPFPILSDPEHEVFRAYRCYDDFEDMPLHGTFLIDGEGRVRWQDVSYTPFTDTEFLLAEAKRLLGLPSSPEIAESGRSTPSGSTGGR